MSKIRPYSLINLPMGSGLNFNKIKNLFKEQKYDELIFFIQTSFSNKSAQILNLLGVARLFSKRDKSQDTFTVKVNGKKVK